MVSPLLVKAAPTGREIVNVTRSGSWVTRGASTVTFDGPESSTTIKRGAYGAVIEISSRNKTTNVTSIKEITYDVGLLSYGDRTEDAEQRILTAENPVKESMNVLSEMNVRQ